ncbi:MAG: nucleoside deaminase [Bacteroidota bacterium]|jgi:tRNA(adenine34) deaminase
MEIQEDEKYMREALKEAQYAFDRDEVPVGAVIVCAGKIIARSYNLTELLIDVTAHAEMQAITSAANAIGGKYLNECSLYVTLEPCLMCAGALGWSQIGTIVYGADDEKKGFSISGAKPLHPKTIMRKGILKEECGTLLKNFFNKKRSE